MAQVNISAETKKQLETMRDAEGHKSLDSVIKLLTERAAHADTYRKLLDTEAVNTNTKAQHATQTSDDDSETGVIDDAIEYQDALTKLQDKYENIDETDLKRLLTYTYRECDSITDAMTYVEGYIQGYNMREREEMRGEINEENLNSINDGIVFLQNVVPGEIEENNKNTLRRLVNEYNVPVVEAVASVIRNIHRNKLSPVTTIKSTPSLIPESRDGEENSWSDPVSDESQTTVKLPPEVDESVKEETVTPTEPESKTDEATDRDTLTVEFGDENEENENDESTDFDNIGFADDNNENK